MAAVLTPDVYAAGSGETVYGGRFAAPALPAWVAALPLWQWYSIPNTALSSVEPSPKPPGGTGPRSKIDAWCGATLKRVGSVYMLGAAGGHGDYFGNEMNALALNVAAPGWAELLGPTPTAQMYNRAPVYADLRRGAIHTYSNTQFHQAGNRMLIVTAGGPHGVGVPDAPDDWLWVSGYHPRVQDGTRPEDRPHMAFDLTTNAWTHPDDLAPIPAGVGGTDGFCCAHPVTNQIYTKDAGWSALKRYTPGTDTWELNVGSAGYVSGTCGAIDPVRERVLMLSSSGDAFGPKVFDIATGALLAVTFGGLGESVLRGGAASVSPVYDEANDIYVALKNTGQGSSDVIETYIIDPDTFEVSQPGDVGTKPARRLAGLQNAAQYVPELRGIVVANSYSANVQFMRTAA